jgi:formamidopyrimidine-DNA glycosylase
MPELPEVETQVRDLQILLGHKILAISSDTPKSFRPSFSEFNREAVGRKILSISRRGKFLVFRLSQNYKMVIHFRMTGHFLIAKDLKALEKCIRHFFQLSGGLVLQFSDIRKFATLELCAKDAPSLSLQKLGAEPLDRDFTFAKFKKIIQKRKGKLKAFLLDQKNIVGVGNIYADEICFAARVHPASEIQNLAQADLKNIFREIKKQLKKGIKNRGTTIGEYVDLKGQGGKNQNSLSAYKRHSLPCKICGTKMQKMKISQRTTSFCPKCQKLK